MDARSIAAKYFGSIGRALATGMIRAEGTSFVLTNHGAKLIDYLIAEAKSHGVDTSNTERWLIELQSATAIKQAERQLESGPES